MRELSTHSLLLIHNLDRCRPHVSLQYCSAEPQTPEKEPRGLGWCKSTEGSLAEVWSDTPLSLCPLLHAAPGAVATPIPCSGEYVPKCQGTSKTTDVMSPSYIFIHELTQHNFSSVTRSHLHCGSNTLCSWERLNLNLLFVSSVSQVEGITFSYLIKLKTSGFSSNRGT